MLQNSFKNIEQFNKGSIAKFLGALDWRAKAVLCDTDEVVNRLYQDELESLAQDELKIVEKIMKNQAVLKKFPKIILPTPNQHYVWGFVKDYTSWLKKSIYSLLDNHTVKIDDPRYPLLDAILPFREQLISIAEEWEDIAKEIIFDETLFMLLQKKPDDIRSPIVRIGQAHFSVADSLYERYYNSWRTSNLSFSVLVSIAVKHESIAERLRGNPLLQSHDYAQLARAHNAVGTYVFEKKRNIGLSFNAFELTDCARNPFNAQWLLKSPFLEKLSDDTIREIAISSVSLAKTIFNDPALFNKLCFFDIVMIAKAHLDIAKLVLDTPHLCAQLRDTHLIEIALAHWEMAKRILATPKLFAKLEVPSQIRLVRKYITFKDFRFDIPSLLEKLSSTQLMYCGIDHIFVAEYILKTPSLVSKLDSVDLRDIKRTVELYNIILMKLGISNGDELYKRSWEHLEPVGKTKTPESELLETVLDMLNSTDDEMQEAIQEILDTSTGAGKKDLELLTMMARVKARKEQRERTETQKSEVLNSFLDILNSTDNEMQKVIQETLDTSTGVEKDRLKLYILMARGKARQEQRERTASHKEHVPLDPLGNTETAESEFFNLILDILNSTDDEIQKVIQETLDTSTAVEKERLELYIRIARAKTRKEQFERTAFRKEDIPTPPLDQLQRLKLESPTTETVSTLTESDPVQRKTPICPLGNAKLQEESELDIYKVMSEVKQELSVKTQALIDLAQQQTFENKVHTQTKPVTNKYSSRYKSQQVFVTDQEMAHSVFGKKRRT